jgi:hypothetical protein
VTSHERCGADDRVTSHERCGAENVHLNHAKDRECREHPHDILTAF